MLEPVLRTIRNGLANLAARGRVLLVDDSRAIQRVQIGLLAGELRERVQRLQPFGFNSVPLPGAFPVIVLCPGGDRGQAVAVALDDVRYRPSGGEPGESGLYDVNGNRVRLRDGVLEVTAAGDLQITVAGAGNVTVSGATDLTAQGGLTLTVTGDVTVNATGNVAVTATGNVSVTAGGSATLAATGLVNLGAPGGPAVARVGDPVVGGVISAGSAKVRAA